MGPTIGDGIDPTTDHGTALCNMLGIDPAQVTAIHVDITPAADAGIVSVIRWESIRRIPLRIIADAITDAVNQHDNEKADRAATALARAGKAADLWQGPEPPC